MAVELYNTTGSPPCTFVRVVAKKLGIELTLHDINLMAKEQLKPEFVKLNPQHTVPTINDNGFVLWESRAIALYFVEKYAPDTSLYPKDVQKRATVNRMIFWESGSFLTAQMAYFRPKWFKGQEPGEELREAYDKALTTAVTLLGDKKFLCGDHVTLPSAVVALKTAVHERDGPCYLRPCVHAAAATRTWHDHGRVGPTAKHRQRAPALKSHCNESARAALVAPCVPAACTARA